MRAKSFKTGKSNGPSTEPCDTPIVVVDCSTNKREFS